MRLTVLGSSGAYPTADNPCSGFLLEHEDFHLLLDVGYATFPALLRHLPATRLDAVYVTHGHPDHCADLSPLLRYRARVDGGDPSPALPVFAPTGALDAVLALDRPGMLDHAIDLHEFAPGDEWQLGPFQLRTAELPHWWTNAAVAIHTSTRSLCYSGDGGPAPRLADLAAGCDLLVAETSFADLVPPDLEGRLSDAAHASEAASRAGVGELMLTHLMPHESPSAAVAVARERYDGRVAWARPGLSREVGQ